MRTTLKIFAAAGAMALSTMSLAGDAVDGPSIVSQPTDAGVDLNYIIALQGDLALLDIRAAMLAALPQSLQQEMQRALPATLLEQPVGLGGPAGDETGVAVATLD